MIIEKIVSWAGKLTQGHHLYFTKQLLLKFFDY